MEKKYEASEAQLKVLEQLTRSQNEEIDNAIDALFVAIGCLVEGDEVLVPISINRLTIIGTLLNELRKH